MALYLGLRDNCKQWGSHLLGIRRRIAGGIAFTITSILFTFAVQSADAVTTISNYTVPTAKLSPTSGTVFVAQTPGASDSNPGTEAKPVKTIKKALALINKNGHDNTIAVKAGVYHESLRAPTSVKIFSYGGGNVWLSGSSVVTGFSKTGQGYKYTGSYAPNLTYPDEGPNPQWRRCNPFVTTLPDQVFVNGQMWEQVASAGSLDSNKQQFYANQASHQLILSKDPGTATVEISDLEVGLVLAGNNSDLEGIGFANYATGCVVGARNADGAPITGALVVTGSNSVVRNNMVVNSSYIGMHFEGDNNQYVGNALVHNGCNGAMGGGNNILFQSNLIKDNNQYGVKVPLTAGIKFGHTSHSRFVGNVVIGNKNHGAWFDQQTQDDHIYGNYFANNGKDGLFYEIGTTGYISSNYFIGNNTGVMLSGSRDTQVWNNTFVNNKDGDVVAREEPRGDANGACQIVGCTSKNNVVKNNVFSNSLGRPMLDTRWCRGNCAAGQAGAGSEQISADDYNGFQSPSDSDPLIRWALSASDSYKASSLSDFHNRYNREANSKETRSNVFVNSGSGDYRLINSSPFVRGATDVPDVIARDLEKLGTNASTVHNLGVRVAPASASFPVRMAVGTGTPGDTTSTTGDDSTSSSTPTSIGGSTSSSTPTSRHNTSSTVSSSSRVGYVIASGNGQIQTFGSMPRMAQAGARSPSSAQIVDVEATKDGRGYYALDIQGHVRASGSAKSYGNTPKLNNGERAVSIMRSKSGRGYNVVTSFGRIFAMGDAPKYSKLDISGSVVSAAATPAHDGLYILIDTGRVITRGNATFAGDIDDKRVKEAAIAADPDGTGYWIVEASGVVHPFVAEKVDNVNMVKVVDVAPYRGGLLILGANGHVKSVGGKKALGDMAGLDGPWAQALTTTDE